MKNKLPQLTKITMRNYLQERKNIPGFVRRMKSSLERFGMKMQSEWAAAEKAAKERADAAKERIARQEQMCKALVSKAQSMIEWANTEYVSAKALHQNKIRILTELTLNWTPQRVLSTHQHFYKLCDALFNDSAAWGRLSWEEQRFISKAFAMLKAEERASIAGAFIAGAVAG